MKGVWWKLKIFWFFIKSVYLEWKTDIWSKSPDDPYCCSDENCLCEQMTVREFYDKIIKTPEGEKHD